MQQRAEVAEAHECRAAGQQVHREQGGAEALEDGVAEDRGEQQRGGQSEHEPRPLLPSGQPSGEEAGGGGHQGGQSAHAAVLARRFISVLMFSKACVAVIFPAAADWSASPTNVVASIWPQSWLSPASMPYRYQCGRIFSRISLISGANLRTIALPV